MTPSPRPLNIMSDPRVFRGSVVARQREEALRIQRELEVRDAEERYRMEVVRNRLNMALGVNGTAGGPEKYRTKKVESIRTETSARLAKLAGKTGKIAVQEWSEASQNGIEKTSPRKAEKKIIPRRLSPIRRDAIKEVVQYPKEIITESRKHLQKPELSFADEILPVKKKSNKTELKNVKFVPLKDETTTNGLHKVVPSFPQQPQKKLFQYRRFNVSPHTPPHTPYGPRYFNDASVQTDEAFEEAFNPTIEEIADTAINDALKNLRDEEDFKMIEEQNEKLLDIVVTQKRRNSELNLSILHHIRNEHELERERQIACRKLIALDCHHMATDFVDDLVHGCIENLANRGLIDDTAKYRSVAADTRQLEKQQRDLQQVALEIQRDFFPYVYAKAEQIFVHKLADSYLKDALFSKDLKNRTNARSKLNDQIHNYQKLTRGFSLSSYSKKYGMHR